MKASIHFQKEIQSYLEQRAEYDELFARSYRNPLKNIEDCVTYILNYVQKSGCAGFSDDEIYGQAVHYYDEADIEIGKPRLQSGSQSYGGTDRRRESGSTQGSYQTSRRRGL